MSESDQSSQEHWYSPDPWQPPEEWTHATPRQVSRANRTFAILRPKAVPVYWGPLTVLDDDEVVPQRVEDVIRRMEVLWAVSLRGDGWKRGRTLRLIKEQGLWDAVSPEEKTFLKSRFPSQQECMGFVWRLECIWVMLWALGYVDELDWPEDQCDVERLGKLLDKIAFEPESCRPATLRSTSELLDALDLMMRLEWAIRDAYLHRDSGVPVDLDWSGRSRFIHVSVSEARLLVHERFYALVWLTNGAAGPGWDNMDLST